MLNEECAADPHPTTSDGARGRTLAAVLVCTHHECATTGEQTLDALAVLVRHTPRSVLIRTRCHHPNHSCGPTTSCRVRLQHCTEDLRPLGDSHDISGSVPDAYRAVQTWLDTQE